MPRKAKVFMFDDFAGILSETEEGQYVFTYDASYLKNKNSLPVSLTLPLQ
jgi:HipA-like protein